MTSVQMTSSRFEYLNKDQMKHQFCHLDSVCLCGGLRVLHSISLPSLSGIRLLVSFYSNLLILLRFSFRLFFCAVRPILFWTFCTKCTTFFSSLEWILNEHQSNLKHYRHSIEALFSTLCVPLISYFIPVWNTLGISFKSVTHGSIYSTYVVQLENYIWSM